MKTNCPNCAVELQFPEISGDNGTIACPSCGSQISLGREGKDTPTVAIERQVLAGRYEIHGQLGKGRFGSVYKALDKTLKRFVAIKIPHSGSLTSKQVELATNEARSIAQLNHPNIVAIYEVLPIGRAPSTDQSKQSITESTHSNLAPRTTPTTNSANPTIRDSSPSNGADPILERENTLCIISECIDGVSLKDCIAQYKGEYRRCAALSSKIARAMHHAHQRNVIHRDLKPANILIDAQEEPHIADFGLARLDRTVDEDDDQTVSRFVMGVRGEVLGTPAYMSPQQALGLADRVDGRTDVYSLGIVLFEMLAGKRPFESGSRALLQQVVHEDLPDPRKFDERVPADLANICLKAAEKNPEDRYKTASLMAEDLDRFLRGDPIEAKPWPWHRKLRRSIVRNRLALAVTTSLLLLFALLSIPFWPQRPEWWDSAPVVTIDTTDHTQDATFLFIKIDERSWIPQDNPPLVLGPFPAPVKERIPPGFYRVVATAPDGRFHEVMRTVEKEPKGPTSAFKHRAVTVKEDGAHELPNVKLFQNSEVIDKRMSLLDGGTFEYSFGTSVTQKFSIPAIAIDRSEITYAEIKERQIELPHMFLMAPAEEENNCIDQVTHNGAIMICENLGKQLCNEVIWKYAKEKSQSIANGATNFDKIPEITSLNPDASAASPVWLNADEPRVVRGVGFSSKDFGFRGYRSTKPTTKADMDRLNSNSTAL